MPRPQIPTTSHLGRANALAPPFECTWSEGGLNAAWVHLTGELDVDTTPQLEETLSHPDSQARLVVVDMRELAFMDSSGVHAIVNASARARQRGSRLVILLDAAVCEPARPGRIHRSTVIEAESAVSTSSHGLGVPEAVELARVLHRLPERLVLLTVEAADTGYGLGLSPQVEAAVPALVAAIQVELGLGPAERA